MNDQTQRQTSPGAGDPTPPGRGEGFTGRAALAAIGGTCAGLARGAVSWARDHFTGDQDPD